MKAVVSDNGCISRIGYSSTGERNTRFLYCPVTENTPHCGDWCPFCQIDTHQVTLHCTGTKVVFEKEVK